MCCDTVHTLCILSGVRLGLRGCQECRGLRVRHVIHRFQCFHECDFSDETDRLKVFRTVQVQPWLHLEGTQGPCSEAEVRVYTSSHLPPPALVTTPVALRAGCRWVWAALPTGWCTRTQTSHSTWSSGKPPCSRDAELSPWTPRRPETKARVSRRTLPDALGTRFRALSWCCPGWPSSGPSAAWRTLFPRGLFCLTLKSLMKRPQWDAAFNAGLFIDRQRFNLRMITVIFGRG